MQAQIKYFPISKTNLFQHYRFQVQLVSIKWNLVCKNNNAVLSMSTKVSICIQCFLFMIHVRSCNRYFKYSSVIYISHVMRKIVFVICQQQRCRSACTSAQSNQGLSCPHSIIPTAAIFENKRDLQSAISEQACSSRTWLHNPYGRISHDVV